MEVRQRDQLIDDDHRIGDDADVDGSIPTDLVRVEVDVDNRRGGIDPLAVVGTEVPVHSEGDQQITRGHCLGAGVVSEQWMSMGQRTPGAAVQENRGADRLGQLGQPIA